jgi:hypothetical protein
MAALRLEESLVAAPTYLAGVLTAHPDCVRQSSACQDDPQLTAVD